MLNINLGEISVFQFNKLSGFEKLRHFITCRNTRNNNEFSLSISSDKDKEMNLKNRILLANSLNISENNFVFQQQEHSCNIKVIDSRHKGSGFYDHSEAIPVNDAMITNCENICLVAMGADCVPILIYDPENKAIGAVHAGWRGTAQSIAYETVKKMEIHFSSKPENLIAGIGPSIGPEVYEVDMPVYNSFLKSFRYCNEIFKPLENGKFLLDLWKANKNQLSEAGLPEKNIEISGLCNYSNHHLFFSSRKGDKGRFAAGIMLQ